LITETRKHGSEDDGVDLDRGNAEGRKREKEKRIDRQRLAAAGKLVTANQGGRFGPSAFLLYFRDSIERDLTARRRPRPTFRASVIRLGGFSFA